MVLYAVYEGTKKEPVVLANQNLSGCVYEEFWIAQDKKRRLNNSHKKLGIKKPFCVIKFTSK